MQTAEQPVGHFCHRLAPEHAHQVVDLRALLEQGLFLAFGQAAGDDHPFRPATALEREHVVDGPIGLLPGLLDESAGVDHDQIGAVGFGHEPIPVKLQQSKHPLAIDEVLRAAEADKGVGALLGPQRGQAARREIHRTRSLDNR